MALVSPRRSRLTVWYEGCDHPGLVLAVVVFVLYGPTLLGGFTLDDYRSLRLMSEYEAGLRSRLGLYCFLDGGEVNRQERRAGWYAWWVGDDVRYRHFRPLAEGLLYLEYTLFGERALCFRLVGLAMYALGVRLVLAFFRLLEVRTDERESSGCRLSRGERLSRWAAMVFAVAACHAIPVTFVSQQCDLIAFALAMGSALLVGRFVRDSGIRRLPLAAILFGLALCSKEAVLPMAVLPVCFGLVLRYVPGSARRTVLCIGVLAAIGSVWLACYAAGGYGSNAWPMLDPLHAPLEYLAALPARAVLLLSTWFIPVNPFLFLFKPGWGAVLYVYGAVGVVGLLALVVMYWRHHRAQRSIWAMALWAVVFVPLLACTLPDDRVMLLPSVGFAYLGAAWMLRRRSDGWARLRTLPFVLFIALQAGTALLASGSMCFMEYEAKRHLEVAADAFGRPPAEGDVLFFLNMARSFEALFMQDRYRWMSGSGGVRVALLSDVANPQVCLIDEWTLRLEARSRPLFVSFVGLMGTSRERPKREGEVFDAGEFEARVIRVEGGKVRAIEIHFRRPITSDSYRFFWSDIMGPPVRYRFEPRGA